MAQYDVYDKEISLGLLVILFFFQILALKALTAATSDGQSDMPHLQPIWILELLLTC